jgi:di/tricarboxylate transporter
VVVTDYPKDEQRPHKFKVAMAIFAASMLLALSSKIPVPIALMTGVAGMLVAGVLHVDEAYAAISWKTVFLMACLIPLGWAMDSSGAAAWLAGHTLEQLPEGFPLWLLQLLIGLLTTVFSLAISHVGATDHHGADRDQRGAGGRRQPHGIRADRGAVGLQQPDDRVQPVMSMVTGPANYTGRDLWRVGGPLSLAYLVVIVIAINLLY